MDSIGKFSSKSNSVTGTFPVKWTGKMMQHPTEGHVQLSAMCNNFTVSLIKINVIIIVECVRTNDEIFIMTKLKLNLMTCRHTTNRLLVHNKVQAEIRQQLLYRSAVILYTYSTLFQKDKSHCLQ